MTGLEIRNEDFSLDIAINKGDTLELMEPILDNNDNELPAGTVVTITEIDANDQCVETKTEDGRLLYLTLASVIKGYREVANG